MITKISFLKKFRSNLWWVHIVPPITVIVYLSFSTVFAASSTLSLGAALQAYILFLLSVTFSATLGYFINDWADIEVDKVAGKPNSAAKLGSHWRIVTALQLLIAALLPWKFLPVRIDTLGLLLVLILVLFVYSVRPIRLKDHAILGVICDGLYGHILPFFIAVNTFWFGSSNPFLSNTFLLLLGTLFLKGLRNISLHQIDDEQADKLAGVRTLAVIIGADRLKKIISYLIIPAELILLILVTYLLANLTYTPFVVLLLFFAFQCLIMLRSEALSILKPIPFYGLRFTLNDYYEKWLPLGCVLALVISKPSYFPFLLLHCFLFPHSLADILESSKNLRAVEFLHRVIGVFSRLIRRRYA